jgi:general secretion pathway protein F
MKAFRYSALDPAGKAISGSAYAHTSADLRDQLLETRMHPLRIRPALFQGRRTLSLSDGEAARLGKDLAQLLTSGLSISQALGLLQARESPRLASIARELRSRLAAGEPLSSALGGVQGQPARFLQALARAGEASGRQAEVLAAGAVSLAAADTLKKRLITLSVYPAFVILIAFGSIAVYAYAVLPALEPAFAGLGDDIPRQTRLVLQFGSVARTIIPVLALLTAGVSLTLAVSAPARTLARDQIAGLLLRGRRSPFQDFIFSSLASRLAVMLKAGVPLAAAWRLAREPVTIAGLARALAAQDSRLMEGAKLSDAIAAIPQSPPDLIHYVALGEQSGQTPQALSDGSMAMASRAQETLERLLSILTPLVIVAVGALVGLITLMVFQGLLAVGDAVSA